MPLMRFRKVTIQVLPPQRSIEVSYIPAGAAMRREQTTVIRTDLIAGFCGAGLTTEVKTGCARLSTLSSAHRMCLNNQGSGVHCPATWRGLRDVTSAVASTVNHRRPQAWAGGHDVTARQDAARMASCPTRCEGQKAAEYARFSF